MLLFTGTVLLLPLYLNCRQVLTKWRTVAGAHQDVSQLAAIKSRHALRAVVTCKTCPPPLLITPVRLQEMENRFLQGLDPGVDYEAIDADTRLDEHWAVQITQDAEDAYFKEQDGGDEGEEEERKEEYDY